MTREGAKEKIWIKNKETYPYSIEDNVDEVIDQIFNDHEAQLKALQSRSCEGCKHFNQMLKYNDCDKGVADNVQILDDAVYANVSLNFCCNRYEAKDNA